MTPVGCKINGPPILPFRPGTPYTRPGGDGWGHPFEFAAGWRSGSASGSYPEGRRFESCTRNQN